METQDTRLHTDLLNRTSVWRNGDPLSFVENYNVAGICVELER